MSHKLRKAATVCLVLSLLFSLISFGGINVFAATQMGTITGTDVRVRNGAGTSYAILGVVNTGDRVTVLGEAKDNAGDKWYHVTTDKGVTGYVFGQYVSLDVNYRPDADFEAYLTAQKFPESYKEPLRQLHAKYPNWVFEARHLNLDWETALTEEAKPRRNLLINSQVKENWKSMEEGCYDWDTKEYISYDTGGWITAQREITAFYMDPRNSLNETKIFQFENLSFSSAHTVDGVKQILKGSFMESLAQTFFDVGKEKGVSPYHLASRALQEQGVNGNGLGRGDVKWTDAAGTVHDYTGYYNFFNISAYEKDGLSAVQNGAINAKSRGWDTPQKAIEGGADQIGKGYINMGQNTLYLQKFDVVDGGNGYYEHQYMSNVTAAYAEAGSMKAAYSEEALNGTIVFSIPVYTNMPSAVCERPVQEDKNNDNTLVGLGVEGYSLTPTFGRYITDYAVSVPDTVERVTVTATKSDKDATVDDNGAEVATASKTVTLSGKETVITIKVTAPSGLVRNYVIHVYRENGADAPSLGSNKYAVGTHLTGITPNTTVTDLLKDLVVNNGSVRVVDAAGNTVTEKAATGQTVQLISVHNTVVATYPIIIYGDVSGDGAVTSKDLLMAQKHILGLVNLSGANLSAADSGKDGKLTSSDLLRTQKQILGLIQPIL